MSSVDNICQAIRLLDLESQSDTVVETKDLVALVNHIAVLETTDRVNKMQISRLERRLSQAISEGLALASMSLDDEIPRLDVRA